MKKISNAIIAFVLVLAPFILRSQDTAKGIGLKPIIRESIKDPLKFSASDWTEGNDLFTQLTSDNIAIFGLNLEIMYKQINPGTSSGGSDYVLFCSTYIPFFSSNAGFDSIYHHYKDETSILNWEKMQSIVKLGFLNI